jgi:hypothetical protein
MNNKIFIPIYIGTSSYSVVDFLGKNNFVEPSNIDSNSYQVWFQGVWFMVFNVTFNNISLISWWSVLLVEEPKFLGENH